uniref:Cytochrome P450 CYP3026B1 n=1 Tax=Tigriopus kingsejongensis TaxID=1133412 RepID=A0A2H4FY87_9MAXI|nr:cytochrome P450 CYP3026B1 [Tigriopus kingsejongensis]
MISEAVILILTLAGLCYLFFRYKTTYWSRLGFPSITEGIVFPLGNDPTFHLDVFLQKRNTAYCMMDLYQKTKDLPFCAYYSVLGNPLLLVNDLDLVKHILIKDFDNFVDRFGALNVFGGDSNVFTDKIWRQQLLSLKGDLWKDVRSIFSPVFTSGKMKLMMHFMKSISRNLQAEMQEAVDAKGPIDLKELFAKYSMDTIATCGFGVDAGSFTATGESKFVEHARNTFARKGIDNFKFLCSALPGVNGFCKMLGMPFFKPEETQFFYDIIMQVIRHRMESKERKNDLVDLMIDAIKFEKTLTPDETETDSHSQYDQDAKLDHKVKKTAQFDETLVVSNSLLILIAGYDTTAMTMTYCAYELARQPNLQDRLLSEIDEALEGLEEGQDFPDYQVIQELPYLDAVLQETLRLHAPIPLVSRVCANDYKIPGHDHVIPKGTEVNMYSYCIMRDERHFPNPDKFDPEHFSREAKAKRNPYAFLPFGQGPRACIGMRFALLEAKIGLIAILSRFRITTCPETPKEAVRDHTTFLGNPRDKLWVAVTPR